MSVHPVPPLLSVADTVELEALGDRLADLRPRVERRVGVLEDDLHPVAERLELLPLEMGDVFARRT